MTIGSSAAESLFSTALSETNFEMETADCMAKLKLEAKYVVKAHAIPSFFIPLTFLRHNLKKQLRR